MTTNLGVRIGIGLLLVISGSALIGVHSTKTLPHHRTATASRIDASAIHDPFLKLAEGRLDYGSYTSEGKWISSAENQGKMVLVYFWATWCQPCHAMLPRLKEICERRRKQNLTFLTIAIDSDPATIGDYLEKQNLDLPYTYFSKKEITEAACIDGVPTLYILSKDSRIMKKIEGIISDEQLESDLKECFIKQ